jgi:hypothetical protein
MEGERWVKKRWKIQEGNGTYLVWCIRERSHSVASVRLLLDLLLLHLLLLHLLLLHLRWLLLLLFHEKHA